MRDSPPKTIVERLRHAALNRARGGPAWALYEDAADEIERLSKRVRALSAKATNPNGDGLHCLCPPIVLGARYTAIAANCPLHGQGD